MSNQWQRCAVTRQIRYVGLKLFVVSAYEGNFNVRWLWQTISVPNWRRVGVELPWIWRGKWAWWIETTLGILCALIFNFKLIPWTFRHRGNRGMADQLKLIWCKSGNAYGHFEDCAPDAFSLFKQPCMWTKSTRAFWFSCLASGSACLFCF